MQQLQATDGAFVAILADGSVIAWGAPLYGGDYSAVSADERAANSAHKFRICCDPG